MFFTDRRKRSFFSSTQQEGFGGIAEGTAAAETGTVTFA